MAFVEGEKNKESVEVSRGDLERYLEAERSNMEAVYPDGDVPDKPGLILSPEASNPTIVNKDDYQAVVLTENSFGSFEVPDNVEGEETWKSILEQKRRENIRHELAHLCYAEHNSNNFTAPLKGSRNPLTAYQEALAMWEGQNAGGTMKPFSLEKYGTEGIEDIPSYWEKFVSSDEDVRTIEDPHRFGALSAYLVEQSHLQRNTLEEAKKRTREDLLSVKGHSELEEVNREAADRLSIPYFPDLIRGKNTDYMDSQLGEKYLSEAKEML